MQNTYNYSKFYEIRSTSCEQSLHRSPRNHSCLSTCFGRCSDFPKQNLQSNLRIYVHQERIFQHCCRLMITSSSNQNSQMLLLKSRQASSCLSFHFINLLLFKYVAKFLKTSYSLLPIPHFMKVLSNNQGHISTSS